MSKPAVKGIGALKYGLNADRTRIVITGTVGEDADRLELDAENVDGMVRQLASLRAKMIEQHPMKLPPGPRKGQGVQDPSLSVSREMFTGDLVLGLRHPGFGWLHFVMSEGHVRVLSKAFQQHMAESRPRSSSPKH